MLSGWFFLSENLILYKQIKIKAAFLNSKRCLNIDKDIMVRNLQGGVFFGWLMVVLLAGCSFQDPPVDGIIVSNIDKEFSVRMFEKLSQDGRNLYFQITSIEEINCQNGTVNYLLNHQEENIYLAIRNVVEPLDCIEGTGPYLSNVNLGALGVGQIFNLTIQLQNIVENQGYLSSDSEKYEMKLNTLYGLEVPETVLYKIPDSFVWGYIAISDLSQRTAADELYASLLSHGFSKILKQGNYGYFDVLPNGLLTGLPTEMENPLSVIPISLGYFGNWEDMTSEVAAFRGNHTTIDVKLYNSTGQTF